MRIVVNLTIVLSDQAQLKAQPVDVNRGLLEALKPPPEERAHLHHASCTLCNDWEQWYDTPGQARQGLAGHQSWCKRKRDDKTSHQAGILGQRDDKTSQGV